MLLPKQSSGNCQKKRLQSEILQENITIRDVSVRGVNRNIPIGSLHIKLGNQSALTMSRDHMNDLIDVNVLHGEVSC